LDLGLKKTVLCAREDPPLHRAQLAFDPVYAARDIW
jgi:hypothetical protein